MIENNIFSCDPMPEINGFSWTIVSHFGCILSQAELLFGERDKEYTILGIEIAHIKQPQIWYPNSGKYVIIQVTEDCIGNMNKALFQVTHEAIHCLCPNSNKVVTTLEEGIATYFSMQYTNNQDISSIELPQYQNAYKLSCQLLEYDKTIIKKAREKVSDISKISKSLLLSICPNIDYILLDELTKKFERNQ